MVLGAVESVQIERAVNFGAPAAAAVDLIVDALEQTDVHLVCIAVTL